MQTLQTAVNDKDFNQIYQIEHSLKGASVSLCLDKLAHLFEEIEIEGKNKKLDNTNKIIAELLAFSNKY